MKLILVVCGTLREFRSFSDEKVEHCRKAVYRRESLICDDTEYRFVNSPDDMRGMRAVGVEFYGTWKNLPRVDAILEQTKIIRLISGTAP